MVRQIYQAGRFLAALILLQSLFFKFSGSEESVYIFTTVGMEPWGRYLVGVVELVAAAMLLGPKYRWAGGLLASVVMTGAIVMHLTSLGVEVMGDGGYLFALAIIVWLSGVVVFAFDTGRT